MTISYYEKMPDGKLHYLDDQLPFELPDGWEWCNLSMIGTTNIGLTYRPTDITPDGVMVLRSCNIVNDQIARVAQGKSVVHVQASEVGKISITYPDHNEQERIAQILELIDNRIAKNECALDSMQKMKKAMLQQLFI